MPLAPFDPSRDFTVRAMTLFAAGKNYASGDAFDKASVPDLVLRRLYAGHQIGYSDDALGGKNRFDPLLHRNKRDALDHDGGRKGGSKRKPSESEIEQATRLANSTDKKGLLDLAEGLETVRKDMNKKAIALELIRAGRGPA